MKVKSGLFWVSVGEEVWDISLEFFSSIVVISVCVLSFVVVCFVVEVEILIYFFNCYGDVDVCLCSFYFESLVILCCK